MTAATRTKPSMGERVEITLRMPPALHARLKELAAAEDVNLNTYIVAALSAVALRLTGRGSRD